jgi:hypothetical protein
MPMKDDEDETDDAEASAIVSKMRGGKSYGEGESPDDADAGSEAFAVAAENVFEALRGRAPSPEESDRFKAALKTAIGACR